MATMVPRKSAAMVSFSTMATLSWIRALPFATASSKPRYPLGAKSRTKRKVKNSDKRHYLWAIVVTLVGFSSVCPADWQASSSFKLQTRKAADKAELLAEGETAILNVLSADGIGSATMSRTGAKWPSTLKVRLNVRTLEFIRISNRTIALSGRLDGNRWTQGPEEKPVTPASIRKVNTCIEVDVPDVLIKDNPEQLSIQWIDAYRQ